MNSIVQMSLFDDGKPKFSERIRRTVHDEVEYFSLVDIMAEFSDTEADARFYWRDTKKRLKADGFDVGDKISQLKLPAKDGKLRSTDCANGQTCLRIVQSIPSPKAEPIREWFAQLGYERLEETANPTLGIRRAQERYVQAQLARGETRDRALAQLPDRIEAVDTFKELMGQVSRICEHPQYGTLVDAEYRSLFGQTAASLKAILNTKSIRDSLPPLQLNYIKTAEHGLTLILSQQDRLPMDAILRAARHVCEPLGKHMREICEMVGIDPITGEPEREN